MKRQRGFQTDHLRRLFRGGLRKAAPAKGRGPHIEIGEPGRSAYREGEGLNFTLERWARLDAALPEELIRRGLVAMRLDREALGEAVRFAEAGRRETRLYESEHFAVDVLCWRSGQLGPIQDHGPSACGLLVVEGTAAEIVFEEAPCGKLTPSRSYVIPEGTVSVARGGEVHAVGNLQAPGVDLVGLFVSSPPAGGRERDLSETVFGRPSVGG